METLDETELRRSLRVLIADDRLLVRKGMQMFLCEHPRVDMVCEVASVRDIRGAMRATPVDIILFDYELLVRQEERIDVLCGQTPAVVLSVPEHLGAIEQVIAMGASGFLLVKATSEDLEDAMMLAVAGGTFLCPSLFRNMLANGWGEAAMPGRATFGYDDLTSDAHDSEKLLSEGKSLKHVAKLLNVSLGDAETAIKRLARLYGRNYREALQEAVSLGVLTTEAHRTTHHRRERLGKDEQE
ncbi:response regulator transcription factor [Chromohalobacter israelensis]|uniref:Response regulator receiver domain protein (CheY-like) n=1 Tax=Chromohalobacter israelensis (strain ATCC BAA-138 / DSM 3043 / CIP 106854 / NCIMB 13768 / 1H11) TaxID=290398 RepID=Q1QT33_CHRI1|nr:response regulator transcription factor [Chromohalobacter salexigens]ABE60375.1 response regulator receiver domain protein (CheY-like) [Chromohalobacter salexigens DSM 3043]